MLPGLGSNH